MSTPTLLAYASAAFAALLGIIVLCTGKRFVAQWLFAAGMAVLAIENVIVGQITNSFELDEIGRLQDWRLLALSLSPGLWLLFSLAYARGNYRESLARWKIAAIAFTLLPVAAAIWTLH